VGSFAADFITVVIQPVRTNAGDAAATPSKFGSQPLASDGGGVGGGAAAAACSRARRAAARQMRRGSPLLLAAQR
jgi:CO/xanthine dehydrogenase Mo-binding subunit